VDDVLDRPLHPYTHGLIGSVPGEAMPGKRLAQIPGSTPSLGRLPPGCAFEPRCSRAVEACRAGAPPLAEGPQGRAYRCINPVPAEEAA
jgi:peptide/nickel transport system ATP-binding protein